jgi:hypothetical protein
MTIGIARATKAEGGCAMADQGNEGKEINIATASEEDESWVTKVVPNGTVTNMKVRHDNRKGFDKFLKEYTGEACKDGQTYKESLDLCDFKFLGVDFVTKPNQRPLKAFVDTYLMKVQLKLYEDYQKELMDAYQKSRLEKNPNGLYPNPFDNAPAVDLYIKSNELKPKNNSDPDFKDQFSFSHWCGITEEHRAMGKGGYQKCGGAIDINYETSPYICVRTGKEYGGEAQDIKPDVLRGEIAAGEGPFSEYKDNMADWRDGKLSLDALTPADQETVNADLKKNKIAKRARTRLVFIPAVDAIDRASIFVDGKPADLSTSKFFKFEDWPDTESKSEVAAYAQRISKLYDQFAAVHRCWVEYFTLGCDPKNPNGTPEKTSDGADHFISQFKIKWDNGTLKTACLPLIQKACSESKDDNVNHYTLDLLETRFNKKDKEKTSNQKAALDTSNEFVKSALKCYYLTRFVKDFEAVIRVTVIGSNEYFLDVGKIKVKTPKSFRNPIKGFLNIPKHVVMAMVIEGGLSWGGTMWRLDSGDMMHFDIRLGFLK